MYIMIAIISFISVFVGAFLLAVLVYIASNNAAKYAKTLTDQSILDNNKATSYSNSIDHQELWRIASIDVDFSKAWKDN